LDVWIGDKFTKESEEKLFICGLWSIFVEKKKQFLFISIETNGGISLILHHKCTERVIFRDKKRKIYISTYTTIVQARVTRPHICR
jgi:hypothetical protein